MLLSGMFPDNIECSANISFWFSCGMFYKKPLGFFQKVEDIAIRSVGYSKRVRCANMSANVCLLVLAMWLVTFSGYKPASHLKAPGSQ